MVSSSLSLKLKKYSVANSAAAVGVGALKSATKSVIVKSISCPTPEIIGRGKSNISLARLSLLKAHRSSIDPPPRQIRIKSNALALFKLL